MTTRTSDQAGTMRVLAFIQARMGSTRFPGKMLTPFCGRPMLACVVDRVQAAQRLSGVVVTTSTGPEDDALATVASSLGVPVFRGSSADVLTRMRRAMEQHPCDLAVRISGDSPLMRPDVIDMVVSQAALDVDLTTNVHPRTFPRGCSVEVFPPQLLTRIESMAPSDSDREHVTALVYRQSDLFTIRAVRNPAGDESAVNLCVDVPADLARLESRAGCAP